MTPLTVISLPFVGHIFHLILRCRGRQAFGKKQCLQQGNIGLSHYLLYFHEDNS